MISPYILFSDRLKQAGEGFKFERLRPGRLKEEFALIFDPRAESPEMCALVDDFFSIVYGIELSLKGNASKIEKVPGSHNSKIFLEVAIDDLEENTINYLKRPDFQSSYLDYILIKHFLGHEFQGYAHDVLPRSLFGSVFMLDKSLHRERLLAIGKMFALADAEAYSPFELKDLLKKAESLDVIIKPVVAIILNRLIAQDIDLLSAS